ncbi:MAG: ATP-grasp domain-containing protein, partial [Methanobacteriota archaeon]
VLKADEAVYIGEAPPQESYLNIEKIIKAALETGCQAVHPGYGFLAENADFARKCRDAGLIFIGPSPEAMELVGDKLTARETMEDAQIPITPGAEIQGDDWNAIAQTAEAIGYPLMIKATAGGGGKGMRMVENPSELKSAIEAGRREARSAFGNGMVYIEKLIRNPRHVEFQVLADEQGNTVHLFERECSIQRRHQKIVEESPSPALDEELRQKMGETACRVMKAVGYTNAGTVEFLLDEEKNFYFLEVNARIQVEHPVTEMVTGLDLVKLQFHIANGHPLPFSQEAVHQQGHAIECRIYAEDPENHFFPSIGKLLHVQEPSGPGIRCDSGIYSGFEITHHYDPILSKLIVHAGTREEAIARMKLALSDYVILGVKTPIPFLLDLFNHPEFVAGNLHTGFLSEHFENWEARYTRERLHAALTAAVFHNPMRQATFSGASAKMPTPWQSVGNWQLFE